ncbi:SRPBCC family protein [Brevibacterium sp. BRM-1]|uniref:SRPBCC family protein n=1 Tax=Brevibacterium sp. BRM-1 TaxID=2999062 RepID=UPI002281D06B|nr:SRPBCC family protein [Brevibacterium sp. BRM-1]WAL41122.1 SRPBCC family protein [Brevibacterium sp. BRM-1]
MKAHEGRDGARGPGSRREGALYVEILIRAPLERVWELTQDPQLHPRWDGRFSRIVPTRLRDNGAQEFRYELSLGFHTITGTGVSLGERHGAHGQRTSALAFDTDDRLSPLGRGRGYWRYIPTDEGVRFITGYDYAPGWGALGRVLDPLLTRRLVWWLTAWSFDRLRLWAEDGTQPERFSGLRALRPGGPRAHRCAKRPPQRGRTIMGDAPASLAEVTR